MKKFLYFAACVGLAGLMSGCACRDYSFSNPFKNRPVRTKVRSWFQGDPCNTCNAPAGQPMNFGTNVSPLCDNCGSVGSIGQPVYSGNVVPGVQLYDDPNLNGPLSTPAFGQGIENPTPVYPDGGVQIRTDAIGTGVASDVVFPPKF